MDSPGKIPKTVQKCYTKLVYHDTGCGRSNLRACLMAMPDGRARSVFRHIAFDDQKRRTEYVL